MRFDVEGLPANYIRVSFFFNQNFYKMDLLIGGKKKEEPVDMAFPFAGVVPNPNGVAGAAIGLFQGGMTLRDYFAGQALHCLLIDVGDLESHRSIAEECYSIANAMMVARKEVKNV